MRVLCVALLVAAPAAAECVNINTASVEELQRIVHVGPERAYALGNGITGREPRSQPAARPCCRLSDFHPPQLSNLSPPLTGLRRPCPRRHRLR